jgi:hypothetical protein
MFTKKRILAAAVLAGLAVSGAVAADDGESKTLSKNPYQQEATSDCSPGPGCFVVFPATTDDVTEITSIACSFAMTNGIVNNAYLRTVNTKFHFNVQPFLYFSDAAGASWALNGTPTFFISKGDSARIDVQTVGSNPEFMDCTISGFHS